MKNQEKSNFVLIDGNALLHRAFHALPPLSDRQGRMLNAVYGFASILLKVIKELKPKYLAATFDLAGPTFRHKEYDGYKATRVAAPDELYQQLEPTKKMLAAFGIPVYEKQGFEADDVIGTVAKQAKNKNSKIKIIIVTGDLDTLQLVDSDKVNVYTLKKGIKDTIVYDEAAVKERFGGLAPEQMVDFKGLKGDPSDNIPGVPGVGEKTAIMLLKQFGSLEKLYKALESKKTKDNLSGKLKEKLLANREQAFFSKYLATIRLDVPVRFSPKEAKWQGYDVEKIKKIFKDFEFYSLMNRLPLSGKVEQSETKLSSRAVFERIEKFHKEKVLSDEIYEIEKKLVPVIEKMQQSGIEVDASYLVRLSQGFAQRLAKIEQKIYKLAGVKFNASSPQQLSQVLFEKLKLEIKGLRKTPGSVISTAASELEKLKDQHPIINLILEHRQESKLKSTYTDGLIKLIDPKTGRLHTEFDQLGTSTGRFSSQSPNLQNIPVKTEVGNEIRKAFVAEKGWQFLSLDYSQLELRVVADLANDKKMIEILSQGRDIHQMTAAEVFEVKPEKVTPSMRRAAKALNFGVIYGMSIHGFSEAAGIPRYRAKDFIKKYFEEFSGVAKYLEKIREKVARDGFVETLFGRRRYIPEINSSAWNLRQAAERMAINMPIQGTSADLAKMAMIKVYEDVVEPSSGKIKMLLQVHDELLFEVDSSILKEAAVKIKKIMEGVYKLKVPLVVEAKAGKNWGEMNALGI